MHWLMLTDTDAPCLQLPANLKQTPDNAEAFEQLFKTEEMIRIAGHGS